MNRTTLAKAPLACTDCHVIPTSMSHSNNTVEIGFGPLAKSAGANPSWNGATCADSYCHGKFPGGTGAAATWTGDTMTCGSCHATPPQTGDHRKHTGEATCADCHGAGYVTGANGTVNKALHINGEKDVAGAKITSYNPATRLCSSTCHGNEPW